MRAVNLIPSEQRSGGTVGARSGGAVFFVVGLLAGVVVLALLYGVSHHQLQSRRAEAATVAARAREVQAQAAQLAPYASFMAIREDRLRSIAQLIGARFDWPSVMGEVSRVLPTGVSLSSLVGTVGSASAATLSSVSAAKTSGSASVSSATPPGATPSVTLGGCASNQAVVAQMLVRLRLISGVTDVSLQNSTKAGGSGPSSGGGSGSGSCPAEDPVFNVQVTFQPLPSASTPSVEALNSQTSASQHGSGSGGSKATAADLTPGGSR